MREINKIRESIIFNYIQAYNNFDIDNMVKDMSSNLTFENIANGEMTISLKGVDAFKHQAELALDYFSYRRQEILSYKHDGFNTIIEIDYQATLAMDFPNGLKKGDQLQLKGTSIFKFNKDNQITHLKDIA
ncbi:MAG: nuclear transport factor 2 family protein [Cecembia sp.]